MGQDSGGSPNSSNCVDSREQIVQAQPPPAPPKKRTRVDGHGREEAIVLNCDEQLDASRARQRQGQTGAASVSVAAHKAAAKASFNSEGEALTSCRGALLAAANEARPFAADAASAALVTTATSVIFRAREEPKQAAAARNRAACESCGPSIRHNQYDGVSSDRLG
eukprot:CAMPEP_0117657604 /NCGR_PEP_ID=MMETSP0804-20121206/5420_1 /TAXON_ID=1074897 /ORGANISM="Tetraselmis astigmatica, Strain CCMP880" /LENGTH=165 /DNA_ID=CAMNT_0005464071 /DNA_START=1187 /DNA_END=1683 /DNA_ORIENTATION=+